MTKQSARCLTAITIAAAAFAASNGLVSAQDEKKNAPSVSGTWTMTVMSHQVGMVLTQEGTKVTGTLMMMGKDVPVEGEFVGGTLTLTSNARFTTPSSTNAEVLHGGAATPSSPLAVKAALQDDGTLAGEMPSANGKPLTWIAERLRERKVRPSAATAAAGPGVTGAWKVAAASPQGKMEFDLVLVQDGERVTGTLTSEHSGELALDGTFAHGTLKFSTGGTGPHAMHLDYTATLKADGTLAGELTGANVTMPWTAARAKK